MDSINKKYKLSHKLQTFNHVKFMKNNYEKLKSEGYISPTEVPVELLEVPTSVETPKVDTDAKISLHEKLYRFATKNGNTLTLGGSENVI